MMKKILHAGYGILRKVKRVYYADVSCNIIMLICNLFMLQDDVNIFTSKDVSHLYFLKRKPFSFQSTMTHMWDMRS